MRVFANGKYFNSKKNKYYPSLMSCDLIPKDQKIWYNNNYRLWGSILDSNNDNWNIRSIN